MDSYLDQGERRRNTNRELASVSFPSLRSGGDPDLDRYLELRHGGQVSAALSIYNSQLRRRYPDEGQRAVLIALRRAGDPRWMDLHERLLAAFASALEKRAAANSDLILSALPANRGRGAWAAIGAVDAILERLGAREAPDTALEIVDRHLRIAKILEDNGGAWRRRAVELARTSELLREYQSLSAREQPDEMDFMARSRRIAERQQNSAGRRPEGGFHDRTPDFYARSAERSRASRETRRSSGSWFDLSRLRFSKTAVAAIELASQPERLEDRVIAWLAKYWRVSLDSRFERTVFLYSSKLGTQHYEIFRTIKLARLHRRSDDEMLTAVSSLLSTGYSYSVSGELYMVRRWRELKPLLAQEPLGGSAAETGARAGHSLPASRRKKSEGARPRSSRTSVPGRGEGPHPLPAGIATTTRRKRRRASAAGVAAPASPAAVEPSPATAVPSPPHAPAPRPAAPAPGRGDHPAPSRGSVSDRIRRLSGRQYDVYRSIFLNQVRDPIRRALQGARRRGAALFDDSSNDAEDLVYDFLAAHYSDPFMDWAASTERKRLASLGFDLGDLEGIIRETWESL